MPRFDNVLFDLDGTLTDPFEGIAASICHAMKSLGHEPPSESELKSAIGPPLRQSFGKFLHTDDTDRMAEALRLYRERYSVTGLFENRVYPGVLEMLESLKLAGMRLFVATSKPSPFARRIVDRFDMASYFQGVHGAELNGALESKNDLLRFLLDTEGLEARRTVMVGDRSHDMVGAKANKVCGVGVMWGYGSREELLDSAADVICDSPTEVVGFLKEA